MQDALNAAFGTSGSDLIQVGAGTFNESFSVGTADGGSATGATVQHGFSVPGTHSGLLTVTDSTNLSSSATTSVTVAAPGARS